MPAKKPSKAPAPKKSAKPSQRTRDNHLKLKSSKIAAEVFVDALTTAPRRKGAIARAARIAYPSQNARSARTTGSRLLADPYVQEMVRARLDRAAEAAGITRQELVGLLAQMASASLADVQNARGDLDWDVAKERGVDHLVSQVAVTERHSEQKRKNAKTGKFTNRITHRRITTTYKMPDKIKAGDLLAELMGWKKQAMKNPVDSARESYEIMRRKQDYADVPDKDLARLAQEAHGLPPSFIPDIMAGVPRR